MEDENNEDTEQLDGGHGPINLPAAVDPPAAVALPAAVDPPASVDPPAAVHPPAAVAPAEVVAPVLAEARTSRRTRVPGAEPSRRSQRIVEKQLAQAAALMVVQEQEAATPPATARQTRQRARPTHNNTQAAAPAKAPRKRRRVAQTTRSQPAENDEPLWKSSKRPEDRTPADGLRRSKRKAAADATQKSFYCVKAKWAVWT